MNLYEMTAALSGDNFTMAGGDVRDGGKKFLLRSVAFKPVCAVVARIRTACVMIGNPVALCSGRQSSSAWLKPRSICRQRCNGTGSSASASANSHSIFCNNNSDRAGTYQS